MNEDDLNKIILNCSICGSFVDPLQKTAVKSRGENPRILIIGRNPGNKEIKNDKPFGGLSGTRLDNWLVGCGNSPEDPRKHVYLTSAIKCFCGPTKSLYKRMQSNCKPILTQQIQMYKPKLVISLGEEAFESIKFIDLKYTQALFNVFKSSEYRLFTDFEHHFEHLVWPHPSPANRMLNSPEIKEKLESTFGIVRRILET